MYEVGVVDNSSVWSDLLLDNVTLQDALDFCMEYVDDDILCIFDKNYIKNSRYFLHGKPVSLPLD